MTQPPLSRTLAQLEAIVGTRLLERDRSHCRLTREGERVHADAQRLLQQFEEAVDGWLRPVPATVLRLGLFFALLPRRFAMIEEAVGQNLPGTSINMSVDRSHVLLAQLRRRQLDAAVVMLPANTEGLTVHPLLETEMVALLPADSRLARKRQVRVRDLPAVGSVMFMRERDNPPLHDYLSRALYARGVRPRDLRVPRDLYAAMAEVSAGRACALVSRTMVDASRTDVAFRPLHADERVPVHLALVSGPWVYQRSTEALAAAVLAYLRDVLAN